MAQQVGQGTPVQDISAALPGEIVALPESSHITPTESPAPPSAHDVVVNNLLKRPIIHRSNSTPVPAPASGLDIPRRLSGTLTPNEPDRVHVQAPTEAVRESSLSALLRGPLDASGGGVTRALGSHIEAVLSAQEEIGRAHLALEGIGALKPARLDLVNSPPEQGQAAAERAAEDDDPDEADLLRRQQGVEELMAKLSELAASIKSYHDIGTPALIFPQTGLPKPRHRLAPPLTEPKTGKRAATIANPDMAHDEPELPPPAPMAAPAPVTVGRRGMQSWFRKNKPIADSPTELSPIERDTEGKSKRPW
ncbi:hypothetical protein CspeluHIS016_0205070 [Cutaneotrichosporon spelunceum]|uniref:Uncharacterized protein n=1 Tax=Cutaneotrichosporon spelunceum TaxID=1672016 RepID=A0AAD3TR74_9TREE|nr:hypothetical protein CspeluHIS016_0205070 [Cutaneotrichosporon spelunceum]